VIIPLDATGLTPATALRGGGEFGFARRRALSLRVQANGVAFSS
jgi:hypothetical protein